MLDPSEVRKLDRQGKNLERWSVPGVTPRPAWPVGLVIAPDGRIVVADRSGHRLVVLEPGGQLAGSVSRRGWEPGLLQRPIALGAFPDGRLAVADQGNGRIQIFKPIPRSEGP